MRRMKTTILPWLTVFVLAAVLQLNCSVHYLITGSMEPAYPTGSLVLVSRLAGPEIGSVCAYHRNGKTVVHRIIAQNEQGYIFKGDANNVQDPYAVSRNEIEGKVVFTFPHISINEGD